MGKTPPSKLLIRDTIVDRMKEKGTLYQPGPDNIPRARYQESGFIVKAKSPTDLMEVLKMQGPSRHFRSALSSLMYRYDRIKRCHIDGERHYKLLLK